MSVGEGSTTTSPPPPNKTKFLAPPKMISEKTRAKDKKQTNLPHHPNINYAQTFQLQYDARIDIDKVMDEAENKVAIKVKFKEIFGKIINNESSAVLSPYSSLSSAVPVTTMVRMLNMYMYPKRYVPSLSPPIKNGEITYCHLYIGTNATFAYWEFDFLEWTKDKDHE